MIEVREAAYFIAVAEELHFGRAAERLQMSQPPLSQAIRQIERALGVQLLHRTTRSVALTSAGAAFLRDARNLVSASRAAELTARRAGDGLAGELRIGAVTSAFNDPLPQLIAQYRQRYPDVDLLLEEVDTHEAADALLGHRLDIVIARLTNAPAGLRHTTLRGDHFVLLRPTSWTQSPKSRRSTLIPEDLATMPWVWIPRRISPDYHDQVLACCHAIGVVPNQRHLTRSIATQLAMVGAGVGVAIAPATAVRGGPAAKSVQQQRLPANVTATTELSAIHRDEPDLLIERFLALYETVRAGSN